MAALPPMKTGYSVRPCRLDDVEAVVTLMNTCAIKKIGHADTTVEKIRSDWQRPDFDQASSQRVALNADDTVIGWAEVHDVEVVVVYTGIYVHPDYETEGIGEYLIEWAETRARQVVEKASTEARVVLRAYTFSPDIDVWYSALIRAAGMQLIRHNWRMEMALDKPQVIPEWPKGITLKVFDATADKRPVFAVRRTAFQDQFGHVDLPFEEDYAGWLHRWKDDFVPELWFLAMDGEMIAGVCLCKASLSGEEDHGWVSALGVLREYRRRGIGEALLYTAFNAFYKMGKKRVSLGVDASSLTGAATLYKRVGMHIAKQFDLYEKELRAGVDLTTHR